jgi:dTDP-4-amino-4,6-dideoxygalactose transaminase
MRIPFVDLQAQYVAHRQAIDGAIAEVIAKSAFVGGEYPRRFEQEFADAAGAAHCIGVANGTDALYIVLRALGIGPGDEVITTAISWIATSEVISQTGATPVFVDVDEYFNIDVRQVRERINPNTKAMIPVHLYGQAAKVDELADLCRAHGLHLIEDCAQAHLSQRRGRPVGTYGIAGTFSFYPGKNLGAYGDAGAIITGDDALATRCRMFANHGALKKHHHEIEGINSRLDGIQAAVLLAKLPHLARWTERRRQIALRYVERLAGVPGVELPKTAEGSSHVFHLFVICTERRDSLQSWLSQGGVETQIHYPTPLPLMPAYRRLSMTPASVPVAARRSREILSLPIYAEMTDEAVDIVCGRIGEFFSGS